jgi:hypothetical protein
MPLVLVDDLDKLDIEPARRIFCDHRETMLQPNVPIVYTVSSDLFYSADFAAIRNRSVLLPCVRLHQQGSPGTRAKDGYETMQAFVLKRMEPGLITDEALDDAIRVSGGLFREMARVMRIATDRAAAAGRDRVELPDVKAAEEEIRGDYRRFLTREDRLTLQHVRSHNRYDDPERVVGLLKTLAVLEYVNGEPWWDVHPALHRLLDEEP